jgi:hypothetical protein
MKKLIILLILLFQFEENIYAQIFANNSTNSRMDISPIGITDRLFIPSSTNTALGENAQFNASTVINNTGIGYRVLQNLGSNFPNAFNGTIILA